MNVPKIEPIKVTEYETKQSKYPHCGRLPIRSIVLGPSGKPVKNYIKEHDMCGSEEKCFFDHYDPEDLEKIIETQRKVTQYMKDHKKKKLYQILILVDDFADDPSFSRNSKLLHSLFTRGRHSMISTIVATHKKTFLKLYQYATDAPSSFLYVKLTASNRNDMFYLNLSKKLSVENIEE